MGILVTHAPSVQPGRLQLNQAVLNAKTANTRPPIPPTTTPLPPGPPFRVVIIMNSPFISSTQMAIQEIHAPPARPGRLRLNQAVLNVNTANPPPPGPLTTPHLPPVAINNELSFILQHTDRYSGDSCTPCTAGTATAKSGSFECKQVKTANTRPLATSPPSFFSTQMGILGINAQSAPRGRRWLNQAVLSATIVNPPYPPLRLPKIYVFFCILLAAHRWIYWR